MSQNEIKSAATAADFDEFDDAFESAQGAFPKGVKVSKAEAASVLVTTTMEPEEPEGSVVTGQPATQEQIAREPEGITSLRELANAFLEMKRQEKLLKAAIDEALPELLAAMHREKMNMFSTEKGLVAVVPATVRRTVDSKRLQECYPELYADVLKVSNVKETLKVTVAM